MNENLKPCPFCGWKAELLEVNAPPVHDFVVVCKGCGASSYYFKKRQDAISYWNSRK